MAFDEAAFDDTVFDETAFDETAFGSKSVQRLNKPEKTKRDNKFTSGYCASINN